MTISDTDKLLINDGSKTKTITFSQFKSGTMLNDTDKFLVNDGSKTETVTWEDIQDGIGPTGSIQSPVAVLTPLNGAGINEGQSYKPLSSAITAFSDTDPTSDASLTFTDATELANMVGPLSQVDENGDVKTLITSTIANVNSTDPLAIALTLADSKDLKFFRAGDVVQKKTYSTNSLEFEFPGYNNNFYIESIRLDGKELWDSTANPSNVPSGPYIEITGATSDANSSTSSGKSTAPYWANGLTGGTPHGRTTDSGWRTIKNERANLSWNETLQFQQVDIFCAQGSPSTLSGNAKISDGTVVANIFVPEQSAHFDEVDGIPEGQILVALAPDLVNNILTVDGGDWTGSDGTSSGDLALRETKVTGPELVAAANDVESLSGNTLGVNGVSGSWREGLNAQGAEVTASAPSPDSIEYTSANGNPLTTQFNGIDATLSKRTWTWQVSNAVIGPWSDFATREDVPGQDGAVPLADRPPLEENKFYQVKVRYDSNNAESVESNFNTFKTGVN